MTDFAWTRKSENHPTAHAVQTGVARALCGAAVPNGLHDAEARHCDRCVAALQRGMALVTATTTRWSGP